MCTVYELFQGFVMRLGDLEIAAEVKLAALMAASIAATLGFL